LSDKNRKKPRVIREEVKDRHTSHWDLDYVSRAELEELMTRPKVSPADGGSLEQQDKSSIQKTGKSRSDDS
jgi:hypothetical protein